MKMSSGMNVRLTPDVRQRLENLAKQSGLKAADLIRMAVERYCDDVETKGTVTIPLRSATPQRAGAMAGKTGEEEPDL